NGPLVTDVQQAQATILQAQQALVKAQQPGGDADLEAQQSVVDQMLANVQSKQDAYTDADLQDAVAGVAQAEAAVSLDQATHDQTTVVASCEGIIGTKSLT